MHVVALLEKELGRTATKDMLPMQPVMSRNLRRRRRPDRRDIVLRPQTSLEGETAFAICRAVPRPLPL